jgi:hypothetical protein
MYNGKSSNLKWSKKREQWENSTKSIRIHKDYEAWSYGEKIGYKYSNKIYMINMHSFSVTTSRHQSTLRGFLTDKLFGREIVLVDMGTMNYGLDYERLTVIRYNMEIVERFYPKKLKEFEVRVTAKEKSDREWRNKEAKRKKIERLGYKTKAGFEKAMLEVNYTRRKDIRHSSEMIKLLDMGYSWEAIKQEWIGGRINIGISDWIDLRWKGIDARELVIPVSGGNGAYSEWVEAMRTIHAEEVKRIFNKPKPVWFWNIQDKLDQIEIGDLMEISKEGYGSREIGEYIAKKRLNGMVDA